MMITPCFFTSHTFIPDVTKAIHTDEQRRLTSPRIAAVEDIQPQHDARDDLFIDEGVTTDLIHSYGRSPRVVRRRDYAPRGYWPTHTSSRDFASPRPWPGSRALATT